MFRRRGVAVADCRARDLPLPVDRFDARDDPALPAPERVEPERVPADLLAPERAAEPVDRPALFAPDRVPDARDPDADVRVPVLAFEAIPTD
ncbi:hypothetical protein GOAMI_19_00350 [Gordonia amicalis NBRC 100051 = JCM 11271]|nr:hypothetical protein GOAMI_19_00350 [Gordonia amicalis NBRC 100051 = JCM 11271]